MSIFPFSQTHVALHNFHPLKFGQFCSTALLSAAYPWSFGGFYYIHVLLPATVTSYMRGKFWSKVHKITTTDVGGWAQAKWRESNKKKAPWMPTGKCLSTRDDGVVRINLFHVWSEGFRGRARVVWCPLVLVSWWRKMRAIGK